MVIPAQIEKLLKQLETALEAKTKERQDFQVCYASCWPPANSRLFSPCTTHRQSTTLWCGSQGSLCRGGTMH